MSEPTTVVVVPERLVAGGDALARLDDGRVLFVSGALPGETVRVEVSQSKRDFVRGHVVDVIERSPDRVEPACPHRRSGCGGCGWMHLDPAAQLSAKAKIVAESLRRIGKLEEPLVERIVEPFGRVSEMGYRTTIRVAGGDDHRPGFHEDHSDRVVGIDSCLIAHPILSGILPEVRVAPGTELKLRTSVATGQVTALWGPVSGRSRRRRRTRRQDGARPVTGLPDGTHIGRRAYLVEQVHDRDLRVSAPSFFQSGAHAAALLVDAVRDVAPDAADARHVLDAYGGIGLFASTVAPRVDHVTLVDSSRSACADAEVNLAGRSATVVCGDVASWAPDRSAGPIDVVVADPARAGLGPRVVDVVSSIAPDTLVLVSCDPVSLARDAALLAERDYVPDRVAVLDLSPQTYHVETVTRFTPRR